MKTNRELQFLTYLSALEAGDAEGILAFLALAEADAELEQMMLDHHQAEEPAEKSKVITPLKRKRADVNRWWGRFGTGLVAAIAMVLVGTAGLIIGSRNQNNAAALSEMLNPSQDPNALTTPNNPAAWSYTCQAEVAQDDNTILLLPNGDIDRSMRVGVNNPFVLNPVTNRGIFGFDAFFEGLRVTIGINSINLRGDCTSTSSAITVYPRDDANKSCSIEEMRLTFPFVKTIEFENNVIRTAFNMPYEQELVLLDAPVDGIYPIIDSQFEGGIPVEDIQVSAGCTSFPLLFPQASESNSSYETRSIALTAFHVNEQTFEHGSMFYIPAINQVWVACETGYWIALPPQAASQSDSQETPPEGFFEAKGNFTGIWQNLPTTPFLMVVPEDAEPYNIYCDLGWATSELRVYKAAYNFMPDAHYANLGMTWGTHRFVSITGDVYIFNDMGGSWHLNPE